MANEVSGSGGNTPEDIQKQSQEFQVRMMGIGAGMANDKTAFDFVMKGLETVKEASSRTTQR
jgi:hypothetical protein